MCYLLLARQRAISLMHKEASDLCVVLNVVLFLLEHR